MRLVSLVLALAPAATAADDPPKIDLKKGVTFTGRAEGTVVEIRPRVTGYLARVLAQDGAAVKKGDILAEIDARPYAAELKGAKAKFTAARARVELAATNLDRLKRAADKGAASKEDVTKAALELEVAKAEADAAQAVVEVAEINLAYTKLIAPIDGRLGQLATTEGNLLRADETLVVSVVAADALFVQFEVDERTVVEIARAKKDTKGKPTVAVAFLGEEGFPHPATLVFTDNVINPDTGALRVRASLPNPKGEHLPGASVRIRLTVQPDK